MTAGYLATARHLLLHAAQKLSSDYAESSAKRARAESDSKYTEGRLKILAKTADETYWKVSIMPTVIQGDSVNLLPGIIRLTGMTAILSALSIPQGYGTPLSKYHQDDDNKDPFAAFLADSSRLPEANGLPKVEGLKGTVPLSSILGMKAMPFNRFYEVTGIAERHLPKTLKAATKLASKAPAMPKPAATATVVPKATEAEDDLTPATATIERFIDEELSSDVAASQSVPFDEVADQIDQQLDNEANPRLVVSQKKGKTTFNRDTLTIYEDQDHVQLDVDHKTLKAIENGQMAVFIRNPDILAFDRATMRLVTKGQGNTELYFVNGSQSMAIIPVAVEGIRQGSGALAAAPKKLNSLNALMAAAYPEPALALVDTVAPAPAPTPKAKKKANKKKAAVVAVKAEQTKSAAKQTETEQAKSEAEQEVALAALAARIEAEMGSSSLSADDLPKLNALADTPGTLVASAGSHVPAAAQPASPAPAVVAPAVAQADADTEASAAFMPEEDRIFAHSTVNWQESDLTIKVGDERSTLLGSEFAKPKIYPISGLAVKVVGSKDSSATDARGEVDLAAVPTGASFLVSIDDPRGKFAPATVEVVQDGSQAKEPIKLLSQKNLSLYSDLYGTIQKSWLGSACITVKAPADQDGVIDVIDGLTVAANTEADGPLYFSKNLPRPNKTSLDSHGRFCFFNIEPGLVELGIKEAKGQWVTGFAVPIFAGRHLEDEIIIGDGQLLRTQVAAVPSGKTQLMDGGRIALEDYRSVDNADLLALGDQASFDSSLPSFHSLAPGYSSYKGQVYVLAKGADLETALYNFSAPNPAAAPSAKSSNDVPVMTALPRGFIEDLHQELYQDQDFGTAGSMFEPSLGSAVVFFGHFAKRVADSVTIKLIDERGLEVDTGWYLSPSHGSSTRGGSSNGSGSRIKGRTAEGQSKAVFFNLKPGMYTAVVETEDGTWLDSQTVAVDFWTVSVVNAGATVGSFPAR